MIRLSGPEAVEIAGEVFWGPVDPHSAEPRRVYFGRVANGAEVIDEVLIMVFRAPRSYTGEDVVEISCHGGVHVTRRILKALLGHGARLAGPGEFTNAQLEGFLAKRIREIRDPLINVCSLVELELDFSEEDAGFPERVVGHPSCALPSGGYRRIAQYEQYR